MTINSREGLIQALHEAAELEHAVLLEYLFAALSLKKFDTEGLNPAQLERGRIWEGRILAVAREEMTHLGTVFNLLTAIGGSPRLERPNFPQPAKTYYPFALSLVRYSDEALHQFIRFELPKGEQPPEPPENRDAFLGDIEPTPIEYEYLGELYAQIRDAFSILDEKTLFIGPPFAQDTEDWSRRMQILRVVDRATADAAIDMIVLQGEGAPGNRAGSHYQTFLDLRAELKAANCDPARPVVANPRTRPHRESPYPGTLLTSPNAVEVAQLFNEIYQACLLMIGQLYGFGGETRGERDALRNAARQIMTMGVRPLAEILTRLPATKDVEAGMAGPTFELHDGLQLATQREARWTILFERLSLIVSASQKIVKIDPRIDFICGNVKLIINNLNQARAAEEQL